jgi:hypothetical protein
LKVELSKRAQRAVARIDARWRKHADQPEIFFEEMLEVVEHLETVSNPGTPCPTNRRPQLKRMLLEKRSVTCTSSATSANSGSTCCTFGMGDANGCRLFEVGDKASKARRG